MWTFEGPLISAGFRFVVQQRFSFSSSRIKLLPAAGRTLLYELPSQEGLRKMEHLEPHIYVSPDDYHRITHGGTLCDRSGGRLGPAGFEAVMKIELER